MSVFFRAVGGFGEIGRNMCAVKINGDVFILDMGLHLPNYIRITEEEHEEFVVLSESRLKKGDAVPQDKFLLDWKDDVKGIILTHAHLDHMGAVPWLAHKYNAPIICTPFTANVLKTIIRDEGIEFNNDIVEVKPGEIFDVHNSVSIEFINTTHSTPQTVLVAIHSSEGIILYGNDFRFDHSPTLGDSPDFKRLKELGKKGVLLMIQDCLYSCKDGNTGSEKDVLETLKSILLDANYKKKGIIITTFASHIERLKNIAFCGKALDRKVCFLGRSFAKYVFAAQDCGIAKFDDVFISKFAKQTRRYLRDVMKKGKEKFLLVVTGHQGEPKATLSKMAEGILPFNFEKGDLVVFSSSVIPTEINEENRAVLDKKLSELNVDIISDVHISGHCFKEDLLDLVDFVKPKNIIPAHGTLDKEDCMISLLKNKGYEEGKNVHVLKNGEELEFV
jgi:ribonuclease J